VFRNLEVTQMFRNNVKTVVLLAGLAALFAGVGSLFGSGGLVIGSILGLVFVGGSYWFSDKIAVRAAGAVPVSEADAPQLYSIVRDLTSRSDMPMPAIYISPAQQPNAFATGRNEHHAAVAVTQGLMQVVDQEELRGVLAHEISHVRNHDILIGSVAAAVALGITFLARMLMWGAIFGGGIGGRDRDGGNVFGAIAMIILAPIAAALLQMSLSRSREYEADRSGAELLGTGEPLARALEKIDAYAKQIPMNIDPAHATAYIINPLTGKKANFANLFSSHPPTEERIARLRQQSVHSH
jgi:heat shock protein HtpX